MIGAGFACGWCISIDFRGPYFVLGGRRGRWTLKNPLGESHVGELPEATVSGVFVMLLPLLRTASSCAAYEALDLRIRRFRQPRFEFVGLIAQARRFLDPIRNPVLQ